MFYAVLAVIAVHTLNCYKLSCNYVTCKHFLVLFHCSTAATAAAFSFAVLYAAFYCKYYYNN